MEGSRVIALASPSATPPRTAKLDAKAKIIRAFENGGTRMMPPTRDMRRMGIDMWGLQPDGGNFTLEVRVDRHAHLTGNGFIPLASDDVAGNRWQRICAADWIAYVAIAAAPDSQSIARHDVFFLFTAADLGRKLTEWIDQYPIKSIARRDFVQSQHSPAAGKTITGLVVPLQEIHNISERFLL